MAASTFPRAPCGRWQSQRSRKPRAWHGKRVRCRGSFFPQNQLQLPITNVDVQAKIIHDCALDVVLTQTFQHNFQGVNTPLVVSYIFPLESTSAVYSMRAILSSGVEIEGLVKEKEEAKREFDQAVQAGDTAVLMSQVDGDIFQFDVGNVQPGESIDIRVSYMTTLEYDDNGNIRLFLPRSITPRFGATDLSAFGVSRMNYDMSVSVDVVTFGKLLNIQCISHPLALRCTRDAHNDNHMTMSLSIPVDSDGMEKDIEVLISQEEVVQTHAVYEHSNTFGTHAFMVSFVAQPMDEERQVEGMQAMTLEDIDEDNSGVELVFLIDRSGSMSGSPIETVKRTLKKFLRSMPEDCKFNMISFSNSYEYFRPDSVVYNDESFTAADEWINQLNASGGTQLFAALDRVLNAGWDPLRARNVFVLTDGAVSNTQDCIKLVDRVGENVRVFTFGIGSGHSTELVNGLAEAGNGTSTSIADLNDIGTKVINALNHALQPVIGDIKVMIQSPPNEGSPLKFDVFPKRMPALFFGRQAIFYAVAHESVQISRDLGLSVCVTGIQNGHKPYRLNIPINISPFSDEGEVGDPKGMFAEYFAGGEGMIAPAASDDTSFFGRPRNVPREMQLMASRSQGLVVHRLAAKARIQELEHRSSGASEFTKKQEILALATRFNLASSRTSFIAVHRDREGRTVGEKTVAQAAIESAKQDHSLDRSSLVFSSLQPLASHAPSSFSFGSSSGFGCGFGSSQSAFGGFGQQQQASVMGGSSFGSRRQESAFSSNFSGGAMGGRALGSGGFGSGNQSYSAKSWSATVSRSSSYSAQSAAPPEMFFGAGGVRRSLETGSSAPPPRSIHGLSCTCGSPFDFIDSSRGYGGGGVNCDICGQRVSGHVYHCPRERVTEHPNGFDICPKCAMIKHYGKATSKCICGVELDCLWTNEAYPGLGVFCDKCSSQVNEEVVYHCPKGKYFAHETGYDLCRNCAVNSIPTPSFDELTNLQKSNGSFQVEVMRFVENVPEIENLMREMQGRSVVSSEDMESVQSTLVALVLFHKLFGDRGGEWKLMERKSLKYVGKCTQQARDIIVSWISQLSQ